MPRRGPRSAAGCAAIVPLPVSAIVSVALSVTTERLPVAFPAPFGENATLSVDDAPAASVSGALADPTTEKAGPETWICETCSAAEPEFVSTTDSAEVLPTVTVPKLSEEVDSVRAPALDVLLIPPAIVVPHPASASVTVIATRACRKRMGRMPGFEARAVDIARRAFVSGTML